MEGGGRPRELVLFTYQPPLKGGYLTVKGGYRLAEERYILLKPRSPGVGLGTRYGNCMSSNISLKKIYIYILVQKRVYQMDAPQQTPEVEQPLQTTRGDLGECGMGHSEASPISIQDISIDNVSSCMVLLKCGFAIRLGQTQRTTELGLVAQLCWWNSSTCLTEDTTSGENLRDHLSTACSRAE